jgi:UDP-N-acetyl-alpha-D-muramoyl-L-alanyl-L-glutamate epimerase
MNTESNQHKYHQLREQYPQLVYESYQVVKTSEHIEITFDFVLGNSFRFRPQSRIPLKKGLLRKGFDVKDIDTLAFYLGMVELVSYWKVACPPQVIIKPFGLDSWMIQWWKKLYFKGLGEFFYVNGIQAGLEDFMEIHAQGTYPPPIDKHIAFNDNVLIPVGGGKDSVVTLELLQHGGMESIPMIVNPRGATIETIEAAGFTMDDVFEVNRSIDPLLLELNSRGFLNGHTPFSALLGMMSAIAAVVTGRRHIALSNESSANESTVKGLDVNHQYSKSLEFETDLRDFIKKCLSPQINYFSFLRPLNELQIARFFSLFPKYFPVFKSCNAGSKTNIWCCNCPKCLFTFIILSPFLEKHTLEEIFGEDLYEKPELEKYFNELIGLSEAKPFECVGTIEEVNMALCLAVKDCKDRNMPHLLNYYIQTSIYQEYKDIFPEEILGQMSSEHFLSAEFLKIMNS